MLVTLTSGAPGAVFGQGVPLFVTVTAVAPASGTPGGTVSILDGTTTLATVALSGGAASATVSTLAVGSHPLVARYGGDPAFVPADGALTQAVAKAPTATALAAAPSPSTYGQAVLLTAAVTVPSPGAGSPAGTVTFKDGATTLGQAPLAAGQATLTTAALAAGTHALTAEYGGDGSFAASTGPLAHPVQKAPTALAIATAPSPASYGQPITITVTGAAVAPGRGTPGGEVVISDGGVVLGRATFDASGLATLTIPAPAAGDHPLTVSYPGDANFAPASSAAGLHVAAGTTEVAVTSTRAVTRRGRPVTFTATVSSPHATPAGTVTFKADGQVLGRAALAEGVAHLTDRSLAEARHRLPHHRRVRRHRRLRRRHRHPAGRPAGGELAAGGRQRHGPRPRRRRRQPGGHPAVRGARLGRPDPGGLGQGRPGPRRPAPARPPPCSSSAAPPRRSSPSASRRTGPR